MGKDLQNDCLLNTINFWHVVAFTSGCCIGGSGYQKVYVLYSSELWKNDKSMAGPLVIVEMLSF